MTTDCSRKRRICSNIASHIVDLDRERQVLVPDEPGEPPLWSSYWCHGCAALSSRRGHPSFLRFNGQANIWIEPINSSRIALNWSWLVTILTRIGLLCLEPFRKIGANIIVIMKCLPARSICIIICHSLHTEIKTTQSGRRPLWFLMLSNALFLR